ncbi:glycosyltransferase family 4 protein [candidate division KSB1 bacterium]|nr:glycosyltransferase family 4 protein [candidate division KSB1 bacterium]
MKKLLVVIIDKLSSLIKKGEITERYYNPDDLFDEVHILMLNNDSPDKARVQKMVGRAKLSISNLPAGKALFLISLGWQKWALNIWAKPAIELAQIFQPNIIRCHGHLLSAYVGALIHNSLNIPCITSLHINPDEDVKNRAATVIQKFICKLEERVEKWALTNADLVLPVYQSIIPYLQRLGISNFEVAYNAINPAFLQKKTDYKLHNPVKIVSVGRLFNLKNPENIILAIKKLPNVHFTSFGDGPYFEYLQKLVIQNHLTNQVKLIPALSNDKLCSMLAKFDIFAVHTEHWEISKSVLESMLTGLPTIINHRTGQPVPEFNDTFVYLVENSVDGYFNAIRNLIENGALREKLGRNAFNQAHKYWAPAQTELNYANIYRRFLPGYVA